MDCKYIVRPFVNKTNKNNSKKRKSCIGTFTESYYNLFKTHKNL